MMRKALSLAIAGVAALLPAALIAQPPADKFAQPMDAKFNYGQLLFYDMRLSADQDIACSNCHEPSQAFADGRAVARNGKRENGARNTPTLLNMRYYTRFALDGRNSSLEAQVLEPFFSVHEHGFRHPNELLERIRSERDLAQAHRTAFPNSDALRIEDIGNALAVYVRHIDQSLFTHHHPKPLVADSALAKQGRDLFESIGCASCHAGDGMTDNKIHLRYQGPITITTEVQAKMDRARLRTLTSKYSRDATDPTLAQLGAFTTTLDPTDLGRFRTPSLRHVSATAPYMHDGSIADLESAIRLEGRRDKRSQAISEADVSAIAAYLKTR